MFEIPDPDQRLRLSCIQNMSGCERQRRVSMHVTDHGLSWLEIAAYITSCVMKCLISFPSRCRQTKS